MTKQTIPNKIPRWFWIGGILFIFMSFTTAKDIEDPTGILLAFFNLPGFIAFKTHFIASLELGALPYILLITFLGPFINGFIYDKLLTYMGY